MDWEVIVADGMSDDGTRAILTEYSLREPRIRVIDNPGCISSIGLNAAVVAARGEIVIRMDAHTEYASDYVRQCVAVLAETGADNVGGAARTKATGLMPTAIAAAYRSPFSTGGARFHDERYEGPVDTVTYGCWKKSTLLRLGLFDKTLVRNQDDELNLRLIRAGGTVWQSRRIALVFAPQNALRSFRAILPVRFLESRRDPKAPYSGVVAASRARGIPGGECRSAGSLRDVRWLGRHLLRALVRPMLGGPVCRVCAPGALGVHHDLCRSRLALAACSAACFRHLSSFVWRRLPGWHGIFPASGGATPCKPGIQRADPLDDERPMPNRQLACPVVQADARIPALDGLRGVASLMVVFAHFGPWNVPDNAGPIVALQHFPRLWLQGVDLFFVLSGFLISGILVGARDSPRYFGTFYARRAFRILPLYYVVFFGYWIATASLGSQAPTSGLLFANPLPIGAYAFYLQNFFMAVAGGLGPAWMAPTWSLAVEEQFYLTLPLIVRNVTDRALLRLSLAAIGGRGSPRAAIQWSRSLTGTANYVLLPTRVDSLAVGVVVMLILRNRYEWLAAHKKSIAWTTLAAFAAWTVYPYVPNPHSGRVAFLGYTISAAVFGSVLLCIILSPRGLIAVFLSTPIMRTLGNMAYSTYLFHLIALHVTFRCFAGKDPSLASVADLWLVLAALCATGALSYCSWSFFEKRLIRTGHQFHY